MFMVIAVVNFYSLDKRRKFVGGYLYSDGGGSGIVGGDGVFSNTGMYLVTDSRIDFRVMVQKDFIN